MEVVHSGGLASKWTIGIEVVNLVYNSYSIIISAGLIFNCRLYDLLMIDQEMMTSVSATSRHTMVEHISHSTLELATCAHSLFILSLSRNFNILPAI